MQQNELKLYSCEYVMETQFRKSSFIVDKLLYPGLYVLAGAPKVGKSWLALELCLSVAHGEQFLKHETNCGHVLYLALEDSLLRLQNRVYEYTDKPADNLDFAILADTIGDGLEQQIEKVKERCSDLKLVVIDTLQMVRGAGEMSYSNDYG